MEEYAYSNNGEDFYGSYPTINDAVQASGEDKVFVGKLVPATTYVNKYSKVLAENAVEHLDNCLSEDIFSDDVIVYLIPEKIEELGNLIVEFIKENGEFYFHGIEEIEEYTRERDE